MNAIHELCGYDVTTSLIAVEYVIPPALLPIVKTMVQPEPDDHDLILAYDIATENVRRLAVMLGLSVDADAYHFTVEASAPSDEVVADQPARMMAR